MTTLPGFRNKLIAKRDILYSLGEGRITRPEATRLAAGDLIGDFVGVDINEFLRRAVDIISSPIDVRDVGKRLRGERFV